MKTKFAIGCLIQWYECNIIEEYLDSLQDAISKYDGEVLVDFTVVRNEDLEKCISHEKKLDKVVVNEQFVVNKSKPFVVISNDSEPSEEKAKIKSAPAKRTGTK